MSDPYQHTGQPPFHKGDLVTSIEAGCYFHCFVAEYEPRWDVSEWLYGSRPIARSLRLATKEDTERWLTELQKKAVFANKQVIDALDIVRRDKMKA